MKFALDRKTEQFMYRLWRPTISYPDQSMRKVSILPHGLISGHNEEISPENDRERWATFDQQMFRKSSVLQESMSSLVKVSSEGKIQGEIGLAIGAENMNEKEKFIESLNSINSFVERHAL